MLDERGLKNISVLKDDPGFAKLNWFSHFRLKTPLEKFSSRNNLLLRSTGVTLPSAKSGKTQVDLVLPSSTGVTFPSDYVPCISEAFKRSLRAPATTNLRWERGLESRYGISMSTKYLSWLIWVWHLQETATLSTDFYSGKQGQEKRFGTGKIKAGMDIANSATRL